MRQNYSKLVIVIIILLSIFSIIVYSVAKKDADLENEFKNLTPNDNNTFTETYIDEKTMASYYFADYNYYLNHDKDQAYSLLDEKLKSEKFESQAVFDSFIDSKLPLKYESYQLDTEDSNYIFYIYTDSLKIIFHTTGVMQYTVEIE